MYIRELKEAMEAKAHLERSRLEIEQQEKLRALRSQAHLEEGKALIRARLALKYQEAETKRGIEHYSLIREMQQERGDKYKLIAEQGARKEKERLERDHQGLMEQLFKERNQTHAEHSRHEAVL